MTQANDTDKRHRRAKYDSRTLTARCGTIPEHYDCPVRGAVIALKRCCDVVIRAMMFSVCAVVVSQASAEQRRQKTQQSSGGRTRKYMHKHHGKQRGGSRRSYLA